MDIWNARPVALPSHLRLAYTTYQVPGARPIFFFFFWCRRSGTVRFRRSSQRKRDEQRLRGWRLLTTVARTISLSILLPLFFSLPAGDGGGHRAQPAPGGRVQSQVAATTITVGVDSWLNITTSTSNVCATRRTTPESCPTCPGATAASLGHGPSGGDLKYGGAPCIL